MKHYGHNSYIFGPFEFCWFEKGQAVWRINNEPFAFWLDLGRLQLTYIKKAGR